MNKVVLIGSVCAQPEGHKMQNGTEKSSFRLAVRKPYRNQDGNYDADFLPIVAWRQTAEFCNRYLEKGRMVAVEGSIQTRSYDAQDGSKRYVTEIIADHVEALGKREKREDKFQEVEDADLPWDK